MQTNNLLHQCWPCLFDKQLLLHILCFRHWQMITNLCSLFWSLFIISSFILPIHSQIYVPLLLRLLLVFFLLLKIPFNSRNPSLTSQPLHPYVSAVQAPTFSPTARRNARPWATPIAAGCRPLCHPTGARDRTTAATCTSPAWTPPCPTLRYLPPSTSPTNRP